MRFLFVIENLRPLSLSELLTKLPWTCARIGRGLSWQHGGPAVCCAAQVLWWLSCVYLRFGAPYRWLLGAPNPLLQLKTGCGFRLPVNGCSELRTHDWVEIGVSSCCLLRVCNIFLCSSMCLQATCASVQLLSLMCTQPGSNRGSSGYQLYTQPGSNWRPSAC